MGKQFWTGILLLALLLGAALGVAWGTEAIHKPAQQQLEQAALLALDEDMATALPLARRAHARWERFWKAIAAVADHSPMDEIDKLFAEMDTFAATDDAQNFAACCAQLSQLIKSMYDAHACAWWNFL